MKTTRDEGFRGEETEDENLETKCFFEEWLAGFRGDFHGFRNGLKRF